MSNHINPIFFPGDPLHSLPQSHLRPAPGIMLYLVTPQPACRLVYACMGDHCGMWGYPTESVWREWGTKTTNFRRNSRLRTGAHGGVHRAM